MPDTTIFNIGHDINMEASALMMQKWGGLASMLLALASIVPAWVHLVGDLRAASGPFAYTLADLLFGPVCAASLPARARL
jgi:hypothetical protein